MTISLGDKVPFFTLPDQWGRPFSLEAALAQGPVVVFFYPKDNTAGCTAEVCSFRDAHAELVQNGVTVVGISSDSVQSHEHFAALHAVPYQLLSDVGGVVRRQWGVPRGLLGLVEGRVTYVLDRHGVVRMKFDAMIQATRHVREALAVLKTLLPSSDADS